MARMVVEFSKGLNECWSLTGRAIESADVAPAPAKPVWDFYLAFYKVGADNYRAPKRDLTNEDVGVITYLLRHHDVPSLLEWARWFWRGYAEEVYDGTAKGVFKLFRFRLPDIQRDLD
jgi:hypothetical protein